MSEPCGGNSRIPYPKRENVINVTEPDDLLKFCKAISLDMKEVFERLDHLEKELDSQKESK